MATDLFTLRRLCKFVETHRETQGTLPTLQDLEKNGFPKEVVREAVQRTLLKELYTDMTSGAVVKVYKVQEDSLV